MSLAFYQAFGWALNWRHSGLAELELAGSRFLLQDFYAKEWAENWMLYVEVDDARAWHMHAESVIAGAFETARMQPPKQEGYGALVTYVWDPSGVLLHFAQTTNSSDLVSTASSQESATSLTQA
ncbi:MAG: VOC family protein [Rhodothermales bacterium]